MNVLEVHEMAHEAGHQAATEIVPTPMIVGTPTTLFGNDIDYAKPTYVLSDGVCGFASIIFPDGRKKYVKELAKAGLVRKNYDRGYRMPVFGYDQSMTRKEAYAYAYANVMNDHGFKCYSQSRMD